MTFAKELVESLHREADALLAEPVAQAASRWCANCGREPIDEGQTECPVCLQWFADNPPPTIAAVDTLKAQNARLVEALRALVEYVAAEMDEWEWEASGALPPSQTEPVRTARALLAEPPEGGA